MEAAMADRVYARVVAVAVAAGAAVLGFPAPSGAATAIVRPANRSRAAVDAASPGDTLFVEPGSYAEPGVACQANPALTCGVAIAKDRHQPDRPDARTAPGRMPPGGRSSFEVRRLRDGRVVAKREGHRVTDLPGTLTDFAAGSP
jgi:hypothetical protein